jgi:IclR family acetate operon transcriptional repressor
MRTAVDRIFDVLQALTAAPAGMALADIAREAHLARPTAHRLLADLIQRRLVRQLSSGMYVLTLDLAMLGFAQLARTGLLDFGQPILDALATHCGELVRFSWLDGERLVFVAEAQGAGPGLRYDGNLGRSAVLHATATGKCLLARVPPAEAIRRVEQQGLLGDSSLGPRSLKTTAALRLELTRVRRQGYAIAMDEAEAGAAAVAVPVVADADHYVGSLAIIGPSARLNRSTLVGWVPALQASAAQIARITPLERYCLKSETSMRRRLGS